MGNGITSIALVFNILLNNALRKIRGINPQERIRPMSILGMVLTATTTEDLLNTIIDLGGTFGSVIRTTIVWVVIIGAFVGIEKAKLPINPITFLSNMLFKSVNDKLDDVQKDFDKKFEDVNKALDQITEKEDKNRFAAIRWEILSFRNSINNGDLFTEVEYQHIFDDCVEYRELHEKYQFTNGYLEEAEKDIREHYNKKRYSNNKYF